MRWLGGSTLAECHMQSFYQRLFRYRERPGHTPLENFSTEALADLLTRMPASKLIDLVSSLFLPLGKAQDDWQKLRETNQLDNLRWSTQETLPNGLRPDLVLWKTANQPLLVVENKISSGIGYAPFSQPNTGLGDDDPEKTTGDGMVGTPDVVSADQLARYGSWMAGCCRGFQWPGAVTFLTLSTNPPAEFGVGEQDLRAPLIFRWLRKYRRRLGARRVWPRTAPPAAAAGARAWWG